MNKATIGIIAVIIVLAGGLIAYSAYKNNQSDNNDVSYNTDSSGDTTLGADAMVEGEATGSPGTVIQSINMPNSGFIVIEKDNNGQPGEVLGKSELLQQGPNQDVKIMTQSELTPGSTYFVSLYADTNQNGQYDQGTDTVMKDQKGQPIQQSFTAPEAGNQNSSSTQDQQQQQQGSQAY